MGALTLPSKFPDALRKYAGRIADIDSHEMIPCQEWVKYFGPEVQPLADYFIAHGDPESENINTISVPGFPGDIGPIADDILDIKGSRAPGAVLPDRRVAVMDSMGISRQLFYPTGIGLLGAALYKSADNPSFMSAVTGDRRKVAKRCFDAYNGWLRSVSRASDRIRPAALLFGETPEELTRNAERLIKQGFKAFFYLPAAEPPGGRSPAHPDLDPFWALLAEANCAFTLHIETDGTPMEKLVWRNAPVFEGFRVQGEINQDPAWLATVHLPYENFLTIMLLGGVFDRHPTLRFGVTEVGSHWVGPMIRRLDMWYAMGAKFGKGDNVAARPTYRLPNTPSFYLQRNVRVTPFPFEDVARDMTQFGLEKVLCFSSDYPHVEGGKNAFAIFHDNIKYLGESVVEDFFVHNGAWLLLA